MRRHSGQKALYEAMSRSRSKPKRLGLLERLRPGLERLRRAGAAKVKRSVSRPEPSVAKPAPMVLKPPKTLEVPEPAVQSPTKTWLRPKAVQFNEGRIEVTLPYQIGIVIGLGLVLLMLVVFRLGQIDQRARYGRTSQSPNAATGNLAAGTGQPGTGVRDAAPAGPSDTDKKTAGPTVVGKNMIVLAVHSRREDLEPVVAYFKDHGIETGIVPFENLRAHFDEKGLDASRLPKGDGFMLVTRRFYHNPDREGTDGHAVLKRIVELGTGYKAPPAKESFAPNYFGDAYGMKILP